jgi:RNA polymerase sigma-70 factor, ECF subfamily
VAKWKLNLLKPAKPGHSINLVAALDDEKDILKLLAARDHDGAFALLLERFRDRVFRLAFSLLRNKTQAADAAQDVFFKIWKALPGYHSGASLSTWIYAITRNTCLTELTRRDRRPTVSLQEPEMAAAADRLPALQCTDPAPGLEMDVQVLLARLPENYRRVIVLFYLEEKAYEEVAQMLGLPLGTVKTLLFRAKKELLRIHNHLSQSGKRDTVTAAKSDLIKKKNPVTASSPSFAQVGTNWRRLITLPCFALKLNY